MNADDKIKEIMAEILEVDPARITDDFGPADAERWDSLNALRMVTALEEAFEVRLTMDQIAAMTTYAAIRSAVSPDG